jgi:TLC domain
LRRAFPHCSYFTDSSLFWAGCKSLPCGVTPSLGERFIYCLELGFYVQAVPMLFFWETKRRDRVEVCAHHVATIILIAYSYYLK